MSQWFYNLNGYMKGPASQKDIQKLLNQGVLTPRDLIFREGDEDWSEIRQFSEFDLRQPQSSQIHEFVRLPDDPDGLKANQWMVLIRQQNHGVTQFVQEGPHTSRELRLRVRRGEVRLSDHVWRQGLTRWKRLGSLPEFDRREHAPTDQWSKWLSLAGVAALIAVLIYVFVPNKLGSDKKNPQIAQKKVAAKKSKSQARSKAKNKKKTRSKKSTSPVIEEAPFVEKKARPMKLKRVKRTKPVAPKKPIPADLRLLSKQPLLKKGILRVLLKGDLRRLQIEVIGRGGEVLSSGSVYRRFEVPQAPSSKRVVREISLATRSVPTGRYKVRVKYGEKLAEGTFFIGEKIGLAKKMAVLLKKEAFKIQEERTELLISLDRHLKALQMLQNKSRWDSQWKVVWGRAERPMLKSYGSSQRNSRFFSESWRDLKKIRSDIRKKVLGTGHRVNSGPLGALRSRLFQMRSAASQLSLWKKISSSSK